MLRTFRLRIGDDELLRKDRYFNKNEIHVCVTVGRLVGRSVGPIGAILFHQKYIGARKCEKRHINIHSRLKKKMTGDADSMFDRERADLEC